MLSMNMSEARKTVWIYLTLLMLHRKSCTRVGAVMVSMNKNRKSSSVLFRSIEEEDNCTGSEKFKIWNGGSEGI